MLAGKLPEHTSLCNPSNVVQTDEKNTGTCGMKTPFNYCGFRMAVGDGLLQNLRVSTFLPISELVIFWTLISLGQCQALAFIAPKNSETWLPLRLFWAEKKENFLFGWWLIKLFVGKSIFFFARWVSIGTPGLGPTGPLPYKVYIFIFSCIFFFAFWPKVCKVCMPGDLSSTFVGYRTPAYFYKTK